MRCQRRAVAFCLAMVLSAAAPSHADGFNGDPGRVAAILSGELLEDGRTLLALSGGPALSRSLRLTSEPSHTPLAFASEVAFSESAEGEAWRAGWVEEPQLFVLVGDIAEVGFEQPVELPADDTRLALWTWVPDGEGGEVEAVVSEADVGRADFVVFSALDDPGAGQTTHCCGLEDGSEACVTCPGAAFGCEPTPACGR